MGPLTVTRTCVCLEVTVLEGSLKGFGSVKETSSSWTNPTYKLYSLCRISLERQGPGREEGEKASKELLNLTRSKFIERKEVTG